MKIKSIILPLFAVLFSGLPAFAHQNKDVSYIYEESSKDAERCFEQVKSGSSFLETADCVEMQKRAGSVARHYFCHKTGDAASCRNHPADRGTTSSRSNNPGTAQNRANTDATSGKKFSDLLLPLVFMVFMAFFYILYFGLFAACTDEASYPLEIRIRRISVKMKLLILPRCGSGKIRTRKISQNAKIVREIFLAKQKLAHIVDALL